MIKRLGDAAVSVGDSVRFLFSRRLRLEPGKRYYSFGDIAPEPVEDRKVVVRSNSLNSPMKMDSPRIPAVSSSSPAPSAPAQPLGWLRCPICAAFFKESGEKMPLVLSCGHTFCRKDVERLCGEKSKLICTTCNKVTELAQYPDRLPPKNYNMIDALQRANGSLETATWDCRGCGARACQTFCLDCKSDFCASCDAAVHRSSLFSAHRRCKIGCIASTDGDAVCDIHGQKLNMFCTFEGCLAPVCKDCSSSAEHTGHKVLPADDVISLEKANLERKCRRQGEVIQGLKALSAKVAATQSELTDNTEMLISNIREDFAIARAMLDEREDAILRALEAHAETSLCELEDKLHKTTLCLDEISGALTEVNEVRDATGMAFLASFVEANDKIDRTTKQAARVMEYALAPAAEFETTCHMSAADAIASINYETAPIGSSKPAGVRVGAESPVTHRRDLLNQFMQIYKVGDRIMIRGCGPAKILEFITLAGNHSGTVKVQYDDGSMYNVSPSDIVEKI